MSRRVEFLGNGMSKLNSHAHSFASFGELLRYLRQRARLTQDELGLAVGYSRAHLARLESNQRAPEVSAVQARFIEALHLEKEAEWAAQLVALATAAHAEVPVDLSPEPDAPAPTQIPNNLPIAMTSFIGRDEELAELKRLLPTTKLLTLTGTGGTGKTRLALQLVGEIIEAYPDGVWLVELAPLTDSALVAQAVAATLNVPVPHGQDTTTALVARLRDKRFLILLDNCEHVIDACTQLANAILRSSPLTQILATSREALDIAGELAWRVPSLQMPDPKERYTLTELRRYATAQLFAERASFALPSFVLNENNMLAVQQICVRLDGIPLAIELAAARVRAMSVETIAERLWDRFHLLAGSGRGVIPRQQTLQALIDWSYSLLTEPERILLGRLSIFSGGWTLDAAEAVCAGDGIETPDVLNLLVRLVDKSLVVMNDLAGVTRYHLLETIRQYAAEKLVDSEEVARVRNRHLDYFLKLGKQVETQLYEAGVNHVHFVKRLAMDLDNVWHALDWAAQADRIEDGIKLISGAFGDLFVIRAGQGKRLDRLQNLLDQPAINKNTYVRAHAYWKLAELAYRQGDFARNNAALDQMRLIARSLNNLEVQSWALSSLAHDALQKKDFTAAKAYFREWQVWASSNKAMDEDQLNQHTIFFQGQVALQAGNYAEAKHWFSQYRAFVSKLNVGKLVTSANARRLGYALLLNGDHAEALAHFQESLTDNYDLGDKLAIGVCLATVAMYAAARGDETIAARLFGASEAICESLYTPPMPWDLEQIQPAIAALRQKMESSAFGREWAAGRAMSLEQAVAYCRVAY